MATFACNVIFQYLFDVASYFLELLSTLFSILMLIDKIDERKAIMALFGYLHRCDAASGMDISVVEAFIAELEPIQKLQSTFTSLESLFHSGLMLPLCILCNRRLRDPSKYMDEFNLIMRSNQVTEPFMDVTLEDSQFYSVRIFVPKHCGSFVTSTVQAFK